MLAARVERSFSASRHSKRTHPQRLRMGGIEALESRDLLAVFTVTNLSDGPVSAPGDLPGSLRQAIYDANSTVGADEIVWEPTNTGTITLTAGELSITDDVSVTGLGRNATVIDAAGNSRVIRTAAPSVSLNSLRVTGGVADQGGRIFNDGDLTLNDAAVTENVGADGVGTANGGDGGGIFSLGGDLTIVDSIVSENSAGISEGGGRGGHGGGIYVLDGKLMIMGSTISGNLAGGLIADGYQGYYYYVNGHVGDGGSGGGIFSRGQGITISDSTISGNQAGNGDWNSGRGGDGGGIQISSGELSIISSVIAQNSAGDGGDQRYGNGEGGDGGNGGGVYSTSGDVTVENSDILGNQAGHGGIALYAYYGGRGDGGSGGGISSAGSLTVTDSMVGGNHAGWGGGTFAFSGSGGGIWGSGTVTITHSTISGNTTPSGSTWTDTTTALYPIERCAGGGSGAGVASSGLTRVTDSIITGNAGGGAGGGLRVFTGDAVISSSTISNNVGGTGGGGSFGSGGFLQNDVTIEGSLIENNRTASCGSGEFGGSGGGLFISSNATISDSSISNNATGSGGWYASDGGGIMLRSGNRPAEVNVIATSITGNAAGSATTTNFYGYGGVGGDGGGLAIYGDTIQVTVDNSLIANNASGSGPTNYGRGGGIDNRAATGLTVTNTTISNNLGVGGGIYSSEMLTVAHSTITSNQGVDAGGILRASGDLSIENSIVVQNDGTAPDLLLGTASSTLRYNLIGNSTGSGLAEAPIGQPDADGNLIGGPSYGTINPQLGPLTDNGGPTLTRAILPGSPAIDSGDPYAAAGVGEVPLSDQRGRPYRRVFSGRIDMGAYERQPAPIVVDMTVDEDDGDVTAGDLSLREAIALANANNGTDSIAFDASVFATPQIISLTLGELAITEAVDIAGPGSELLTIDGDHGSRIFQVNDGSASIQDVSLSGMTLINGQANTGGAILSQENLTLTELMISAHTASGAGGGIAHQHGMLMVAQTSIAGNTAGAGGGGISVDSGRAEILSSTISENSSQSGQTAGGGGIAINSGSMLISNSTISRNVETRLAGGDSFGGGGIGNTSGLLTIRHSTIADNRLNASSGGSPATGRWFGGTSHARSHALGRQLRRRWRPRHCGRDHGTLQPDRRSRGRNDPRSGRVGDRFRSDAGPFTRQRRADVDACPVGATCLQGRRSECHRRDGRRPPARSARPGLRSHQGRTHRHRRLRGRPVSTTCVRL